MGNRIDLHHTHASRRDASRAHTTMRCVTRTHHNEMRHAHIQRRNASCAHTTINAVILWQLFKSLLRIHNDTLNVHVDLAKNTIKFLVFSKIHIFFQDRYSTGYFTSVIINFHGLQRQQFLTAPLAARNLVINALTSHSNCTLNALRSMP